VACAVAGTPVASESLKAAAKPNLGTQLQFTSGPNTINVSIGPQDWQVTCNGTVKSGKYNPSATKAHSVTVAWVASVTPGVEGYFVYRDGVRLNLGPVAALSYEDLAVVSGKTYGYVVTAVEGGVESVPSDPPAVAVIP
jgi:hypothetical protein